MKDKCTVDDLVILLEIARAEGHVDIWCAGALHWARKASSEIETLEGTINMLRTNPCAADSSPTKETDELRRTIVAVIRMWFVQPKNRNTNERLARLMNGLAEVTKEQWPEHADDVVHAILGIETSAD